MRYMRYILRYILTMILIFVKDYIEHKLRKKTIFYIAL